MLLGVRACDAIRRTQTCPTILSEQERFHVPLRVPSSDKHGLDRFHYTLLQSPQNLLSQYSLSGTPPMMSSSSLVSTPYPDLLTPRGFPELLSRPDYDPFALMPSDPLPQPPRVFLTPTLLESARRNIRRVSWLRHALDRLLDSLNQLPAHPALPTPHPDPALNTRLMGLAFRSALALHLTGRLSFRRNALALFRLFADAYPHWPTHRDRRATGNGLAESRFLLTAAWTFDLLAADGLRPSDEAKFHNLLRQMIQTASSNPHRTCSNHNAWHLAARLAAGSALGDRKQIHHALYGTPDPVGWRYGLLHQWRHDFLPDGVHWEGSLGYHFYTLMAMTEAFCTLAHLGCPVWNKPLPAQQKNDGADKPRAYGPPLVTRTVKDFYDTPFFWTHPNGDLPLFHDSGLAHLRGVHVWGILYNKAWEAWSDPKYSWLLHRMEKEYPPERREFPHLPMPLQTSLGDADFARLRDAEYPPGTFRLPRRSLRLSFEGLSTNGSSLFPHTGAAILRSSTSPSHALSAAFHWGPHWAGHMNPAALNVELWAHGRRISAGSSPAGYDDPLHLNWNRTTVAHNTVVVNERSMFPYDSENPSSPWEDDTWRDRNSDGRLEGFQTEPEFKAIRASNVNVYPGVRLDRTLLVTASYILDIFRVCSDIIHSLDWVHHVYGMLAHPGETLPIALPDVRGYRLLRNARRLTGPLSKKTYPASWQIPPGGIVHLTLWTSHSAVLIYADDPTPDQPKPFLGALDPLPPSTAILARTRGRSVLFVALWSVSDRPMMFHIRKGTPSTDVEVEVPLSRSHHLWTFPAAPRSTPSAIVLSHPSSRNIP